MFFGVRTIELGIEFQEVLSRAAQPIISAIITVAPIIGTFVFIIFLAFLSDAKIRENIGKIISVTVSAALLGVFTFSASIAWDLGQKRAEDSIQVMPIYRFSDQSILDEVLRITRATNTPMSTNTPVFRHVAATEEHHYIHTEYEGERYSWTIRLSRSDSDNSFVFIRR